MIEIDDKQIQLRFMERQKERLSACFNEVLKTEAGRRLVWMIIEDGKPFADAFTGDSKTFYILGAQKKSRELFALLVENDEAYKLARKEKAAQEEKDKVWLANEKQKQQSKRFK